VVLVVSICHLPFCLFVVFDAQSSVVVTRLQNRKWQIKNRKSQMINDDKLKIDP
jgi:hypothetical protein